MFNIVFNKGGKSIKRGKEESFQPMVWDTGRALCKRMKLDPYLAPNTKINSVQLRPEYKSQNRKLSEEHIDVNVQVVGLGNGFLSMNQRYEQRKRK